MQKNYARKCTHEVDDISCIPLHSSANSCDNTTQAMPRKDNPIIRMNSLSIVPGIKKAVMEARGSLKGYYNKEVGGINGLLAAQSMLY